MRTHSPTDPTRGEVGFFQLGSMMLRHARFISYSALTVGLVAALILVFTHNRYTSYASILPSGLPVPLADLKSQIGLAPALPISENSSDLYPVVLRSRLIGDSVLARTYNFSNARRSFSLTLSEYLNEDNPDLLHRALDKLLDVNVDHTSGVIRLGVESRYPELSRQILKAYLEELEKFNRQKRHSKAWDNARYLDNQLADITRELERNEDSLEQFRLLNRNWSSSSNPEIVKKELRLRRAVELKATTVAYLTQEYEASKFEAQKDTPILRVLDEPSLPELKSGPHRTVILASFVALALLASIILAVAYESARRRAETSEKEAYRTLRSELSEVLPNTLRLLRRRGRNEVIKPT